jgi:hypothetical protein
MFCTLDTPPPITIMSGSRMLITCARPRVKSTITWPDQARADHRNMFSANQDLGLELAIGILT